MDFFRLDFIFGFCEFILICVDELIMWLVGVVGFDKIYFFFIDF